MTILLYRKMEIAVTQLETAVRLYQEHNDPFSVITLAGAAEEIFGRYAKASGNTNALEVLNNAAVAIQRFEGEEKPLEVKSRANRARNHLKHLDWPDDYVSIDAWQEAEDMVNRAIENYWLVDECSSPSIEAFLQTNRPTRS